jgi:hypothetical protein
MSRCSQLCGRIAHLFLCCCAIVTRCAELRARIQQITDGEYATAKRDVDALRAELGQPPLPGLQATLEEKSQQYVLIGGTT